MAETWVGGDGTGDQQTDSSRAGNWSGGVPGSGDEVVIPNTTHECRLVTSYTWGSLEIQTSGEIDGNGKSITLDDGGVANVFDNLGTITGILDIKCNGSTGRNILNNGAGNIRNLEIDRTGVVFTLAFTLRLDGTLIITTGSELDTGSDRLLVVGGTTTIDGTLTANSSNITFQDDVTATGEYSATDGTTTLYRDWRSAANKITHNGGTFKWATTTADGATIATNGSATATTGINNIEISGSGITVSPNEWELSIYGNLTVTLGTFDTNYGVGDWDLTVRGTTQVTGTLTCNGSTISLGTGLTSGWGLDIQSGGTFTGGTGTHTIGSIFAASAGTRTITLSSGDTTIDSKNTGNGYTINLASGTTFNHGSGTVTMTYAGNTLIQLSSGTLAFNTFTYNATTRTLELRSAMSCAGNLTITAGTLDTGADLALTTAGYIHGAGTLAANSSTIRIANV